MTAEKYYKLLQDNGVMKLLKRQDTRDKVKSKLIMAFGIETKNMLKKLGDQLNNEKFMETIDSQNKKWNELNKLFLTKHGISPIRDNVFMEFYADLLEEQMKKGELK